MKSIFKLLIPCIFALLITSCSNSKKLRIFTELEHDSSSLLVAGKADFTIKPGDILQISVFAPDPEILRTFSSNAGPTNAISASSGYLVNDSGIIQFPLLGGIKCSGLHKSQLEDSLKNLLLIKKFALDPIINVRVVNFNITVLGEVNRPGVINIPNEKVNIIDAIGLAGDLTVYAKRDNLLIIREINGRKHYIRFSLNDPNIFKKDYYVLQNKDIIYVEPIKAKDSSVNNRGTQAYSLILTTISVLILVYTQLIPR